MKKKKKILIFDKNHILQNVFQSINKKFLIKITIYKKFFELYLINENFFLKHQKLSNYMKKTPLIINF